MGKGDSIDVDGCVLLKYELGREKQELQFLYTFDFLQKNLTTVPFLAYPDTSKPHILYTDASDDYTGTCLCQEQDIQRDMKLNEPNEKSIQGLSHKLTALQTNWPTIEKEAFAII